MIEEFEQLFPNDWNPSRLSALRMTMSSESKSEWKPSRRAS